MDFQRGDAMTTKRILAATIAMRQMGKCIKNSFGIKQHTTEKSDGDLASDVDFACDALFRDILLKEFPDDGMCSEETEERNGTSGYRWILDPLDGTHNFLAGLDICGSLLALEYNGVVVWATASFPLRNEFFIATKGEGVFCNGKRISVNNSAALRNEIFFSAGSARKDPLVIRDIERFGSAGCRIRIFGSSPFSFTRLAMGKGIVAAMRGATPWDLATAMLFVREAGGTVSDENGNMDFSVDTVKNVLASNGIVHDDGLALFHD